MLFVGAMLYDVLFPSFVAGIMNYQVSSALGVVYFPGPISFAHVFSSYFFLKVCLAGLFFGICSFILIESLNFFEVLSRRIDVAKPVKGLIAGSALAILAWLFPLATLGSDSIRSRAFSREGMCRIRHFCSRRCLPRSRLPSVEAGEL